MHARIGSLPLQVGLIVTYPGLTQKKPQAQGLGQECGLSMKGRKSARGFGASVQAGPVQDADVVAVQIEALRQQRAQLARAGVVLERMSELDDAAPLAARFGGALRRGAG